MIGFSTTYRSGGRRAISEALRKQESLINIPFAAIADATEEAILNAIFKATTLVGYNGRIRQALPIAPVLERLKRAGILVQ